MKKIISILLIAVILLYLVSCAELVSEKVIEVEAIITAVDYTPESRSRFVTILADYKIYFEYEGIYGSFDVDEVTYHFYKDKVGETVKCNLFTCTYDDGSIEQTLKLKENNK